MCSMSFSATIASLTKYRVKEDNQGGEKKYQVYFIRIDVCIETANNADFDHFRFFEWLRAGTNIA